MPKLRLIGEIVWTFTAGAVAACLFATFWLFVGLAIINFPLGLAFSRFPHWLIVCDLIVAGVVYVIAAIVGIALAPIARAFGGR